MKRTRAGLLCLGATLLLGACSGASSSADDEQVGSPGGAFASPHGEPAPTAEASTGEEGGSDADDAAIRSDSAPDAYRPYDARPEDGGAGYVDAAPTGCISEAVAADAAAFSPTLPTVVPTAACGAGDLSALFEACFGPGATYAACVAWEPGGGGTGDPPSCAACIWGTTRWTGAPTNAFPSEPTIVLVNEPACIRAEDPSPSGIECAQDLADLVECEAASCAGCTRYAGGADGGGDDPDGTGLDACESAADDGACSSYVTAANVACSEEGADGGVESVCLPSAGATFETSFIATAAVLCGRS
jgi:hypothetical protein